jgi:sugar phosphate isomerase/epimerase
MAIVGVSSRLLWEAEKNIILAMDFIAKNADAVERWLMPPFFPSWRMPDMKGGLDRMKDALTVYELKTTIHAPHHDLNMASLNPAASSTAVREVEKCLEIADYLGSSTVTFHPGGYKHWRDEGFEALKASLSRIDSKAKEYNAVPCLENMFGDNKYCASGSELAEIMQPLERVRVTLDVAHALSQDEGIADFIGKVKGRVKNVHISNLRNRHHQHLPLNAGDFDFKEALSTLRKAGYDGIFILEGVSKNPYEAVPKDVQELRRMLSEAGFT